MALMLTAEVTAANPVAGDIYLDASRSAVVVSEDSFEAIEQRWRSRILLQRGEWFVDQNLGTRWLDGDDKGLLGRKATRANQALITDRVRRITKETRGIKAIEKLSATFEGHSLSIATTVKLADGTIRTLSVYV